MNNRLLELNGVTEEECKPREISQLDEIEAQVLYTALMTDTLIEE